MDDTLLMRVLQRLGHLAQERRGLPRIDRAFGHEVFQRAAGNVLHHQVWRAFGFAVVVHGEDVRMIEFSDGLRFDLEAFQKAGLIQQKLRQYLDRHNAIEPRLVGFVDRRHAAAADRLDQLILTEGFAAEISHEE